MSENKIKYGLKNVHYAVVTEVLGVVSYGTPVAIPGAVNLSMSPEGEETEFEADDTEYFAANSNNGYSGDLEIALVPDSYRADVLGETIDSNGAYIENKDALIKRFALMFEFQGDEKATRHVMYNILANRPKVESSTKGKSIDPKTEVLSMKAKPAVDSGDVKAKLEYGKTGYSTFYSAVYLENAVTNTLATASGTFSKAAAADKTIDATSTSGTNAVKDVKCNGISIGGANLTITGIDVTIESTYIAALTNGTYTITVEFVQGNAVTYVLTVTA